MSIPSASSSSGKVVKRCITYSEKDDPWNKGASDIVVMDKGDEVLLPHIDSCVGLIIKLKDGRTACAHVSQMPEGVDDVNPMLSLQAMHKSLVTLVGKDNFASVTAIGSGEDWTSTMLSGFFAGTTIDVDTRTKPHGVDVTVTSNGSFDVVDCPPPKKL